MDGVGGGVDPFLKSGLLRRFKTDSWKHNDLLALE